MPQVNFEVIHAISGRLRLRVPRLRYDEPYALRLQGLLEATNGITGVRVNPAAMSITINCERAWFNDPDFQTAILNSLQQAADPGITPQISLHFDIYRAHGLSAYEFQQLQEIKNSWNAQPGGLSAWLAKVLGIFSARRRPLDPARGLSEDLCSAREGYRTLAGILAYFARRGTLPRLS